MNDNLKGDLDGLMGSVETLNIAMERINDGPLRKPTQTATDFVNTATERVQRDPELASTLATVAAVVVGGLAIAVAGICGRWA